VRNGNVAQETDKQVRATIYTRIWNWGTRIHIVARQFEGEGERKLAVAPPMLGSYLAS
jgi:hypothetical protein